MAQVGHSEHIVELHILPDIASRPKCIKLLSEQGVPYKAVAQCYTMLLILKLNPQSKISVKKVSIVCLMTCIMVWS